MRFLSKHYAKPLSFFALLTLFGCGNQHGPAKADKTGENVISPSAFKGGNWAHVASRTCDGTAMPLVEGERFKWDLTFLSHVRARLDRQCKVLGVFYADADLRSASSDGTSESAGALHLNSSNLCANDQDLDKPIKMEDPKIDGYHYNIKVTQQGTSLLIKNGSINVPWDDLCKGTLQFQLVP